MRETSRFPFLGEVCVCVAFLPSEPHFADSGYRNPPLHMLCSSVPFPEGKAFPSVTALGSPMHSN